MIKALKSNRELLSYVVAVAIIAIATYVSNYYNPAAVFWDENYHIASAQKYIEGVMYMEPHPPLGKLFIALGEWLLHPNEGKDLLYFTQTDYIKHFPKGYSFAGVRLFPTLFGAASGVLFFMILYRISRHAEYSFLFSSLYLFANAFILQSRSAMLEATQMFFIFSTILYFLILIDKEKLTFKNYFILGIWMGLATAVKLNGLIITLMYPFLYFYALESSRNIYGHIKYFILYGLSVVAGIVAVFIAVFYIHFALTDTLGKKHYKASPEYIKILQEKKNASPLSFTTMMKDNIIYMANYAKGVPKFNPCKKNENGSLASTWPFGNKSINFRWAKKDAKVRYLYLQSNPVIWFSVVAAIILAIALLLGKFVFGLHVKDRRLFYLISLFTTMYLSYMITMFNIERVMYLYHYFVALFFGTFVLFLLFNYIFKEQIATKSRVLYAAVLLFVAEILFAYWWFSPFTYYRPLTTLEFMDRVWFDFWKLKPII